MQENGIAIVGQCNISHPSSPDTSFSFSLTSTSPLDELDGSTDPIQNIVFSKDDDDSHQPLAARISREILIISL